jgi:hypothetical protein
MVAPRNRGYQLNLLIITGPGLKTQGTRNKEQGTRNKEQAAQPTAHQDTRIKKFFLII